MKGATLYVSSEGTQSIRLQAYKIVHGVDGSGVPFAVIEESINLREADCGDVGALIDAANELASITGETMRLIIIDTLAMALAGGDENSVKDMGSVVANARALQKDTGATVLIVHHPGKDEDRGMRGSSALRAAIETELHIGKSTITVKKQRDGKTGETFPFRLHQVVIGKNSRGREVTSCVAVPADQSARLDFALPELKKGTDASRALDLLEKLIRSDGVEAATLDPAIEAFDAWDKVVRVSAWQERLKQDFAKTAKGKHRKDEAIQTAVRRATALLNRGHVCMSGGYVGLWRLMGDKRDMSANAATLGELSVQRTEPINDVTFEQAPSLSFVTKTFWASDMTT
jgi:hypothetical protein